MREKKRNGTIIDGIRTSSNMCNEWCCGVHISFPFIFYAICVCVYASFYFSLRLHHVMRIDLL